MKYILTHRNMVRSARALADEISRIVGEQILVKTNTRVNRYDECIIRYGNSAGTFDGVGNNTEYNDPDIIRLVGNKLTLSRFLSADTQPEKLRHVNLHFRNNLEPNEFPIVVRTEINGNGGRGIVICKNIEEFRPYSNYPWSHWYNFQFELGVHILGGGISRVFKKVRQEGLEEEEFPIRNSQRGYAFKLKNDWKTVYSGLEGFISKIYDIIPIQFARVDIGYNKETGGYRLIEINSAPGLAENQNTLKAYADFLAKRLF